MSVAAARGVHKTAAGAATGGSGGQTGRARVLYSVFVAVPPRLEVTVTDAGFVATVAVKL